MRLFVIVCGVSAAAILSPASAQTLEASQAPVKAAAVIEAPAKAEVLRAGTEVLLSMREELTTLKKKLRVGQRIQMEVVGDVMAHGAVVIPARTPAIGEITEVRNKGMWGKSGYIGARVVSLRLGDRHVRMSGTFDDKGVTGTAGVVAAVAFIPVAGFFTTGTSAVIPMGAQVKAFLDEDLHFRPLAAAPQVLDVSVPVSASIPSAGTSVGAAAKQQ